MSLCLLLYFQLFANFKKAFEKISYLVIEKTSKSLRYITLDKKSRDIAFLI